jgi:hypothetical protein
MSSIAPKITVLNDARHLALKRGFLFRDAIIQVASEIAKSSQGPDKIEVGAEQVQSACANHKYVHRLVETFMDMVINDSPTEGCTRRVA